ncbi:hypothetical protein TKK_0003312 [Trichogramma kaykai]
METSGLFNPVVRVKVEPCDDLLTQNNYEPIDEISVTENVKYERFLQENSIREVRKYDEYQENDDLQIELECTDMKPYLLTVAKIEDYSPNFRQHSDVYKNGSKGKLETDGTVKKEIFSEEETNLNFGRGLSEEDETGSVSKDINYNHRLKTHTESARNGNVTSACDVCRKSFRFKSYLQRHIDSVHRKMRHACDVCQKTFSSKSNLRKHIDSVHYQACQIFAYITHACETCGKTFGHKRNLKDHQIAHHPRISAK